MPLAPHEQTELLARLLGRVARGDSVSLDQFDVLSASPQELGLLVRKGAVRLADGVDLLDEDAIRNALSPAATAWLRDLVVFPAVDSTNTRMAAAAGSASVDGCVWFAELQTAGRGRRGRRWFTPFARNIAVTLGFALASPPVAPGGLSLAVGLAIARLLQAQGLAGVAVKWPNDIYIDDAKVCGVLIELVARADACDSIIGVGLNVDLPDMVRARIDQRVTDLRGQGVTTSRNAIAGGLVCAIVDAVKSFRRQGFAPMRSAYDGLHLCQGKRVEIALGAGVRTGTVLGVSATGALRVRCGGKVNEFTGGEVSLRPSG